MKTNYPTRKVGDVCDVQAGFGFPLNLQGKEAGDFPFFKVSDMNTDRDVAFLTNANHYLDRDDLKKNGYKIFPAGTIVFPKIGGAIATNKKRILGVDGLYDNNVMGLVPSEKILSEYLYHWMKLQDISRWSSGTSLPAIKKSFVEELEIPLPPLSEQKKIVARLEKVLGKIKEAKRLRAEAQTAASTLLSAELHKIFQEGNWKEGSFRDFVADGNKSGIKPGPFGSSLKKEFYVKEGYKIYGQEQVISGDAHHGDYYVDEQKYNELKAFRVSAGDVLISLVGTVGKVLIVPEDFEPGVINPRLIKITPDKSKADAKFIAYILRSPLIIEQVAHRGHGATMNILNKSILESIKIKIPPLAEQKKIVAHLDALAGKIARVREYQAKTAGDLDALEKSVLAKAFAENELYCNQLIS